MSQKLLETFTRRWHERLLETPEVVHQLAEHRGVTDIEAVKHLELGLVVVPSPNKLDTNTYRMLKTFGILDPDLIGMVSLPLRTWDNRITNYYFISVNGHEDRIIRSGGVINLKAFNVFKSLVLVDNMADFFAYLQCVKENVVPLVQSERMPGDVADAIRRSKIEEIVLLNDSPYWELLKERLKTTDVKVFDVVLPEGKSVTEYLKDQSPQRLTAYIEAEKAKVIKRVKEEQPLEEARKEYLSVIEETGELRFMGGDRSYRVRGFNRDGFEKIVQLSLEIEGRSFPDKIDLSRSQGRARFANIAALEFELSPDTIRNDLTYIYKTLDKTQDERFKAKSGIDEKNVHVVTPDEIRKAIDLAVGRDVLTELLMKDTERIGFVDEDVNKKLFYVAATSRLTGKPISVLDISPSGTGKSFCMQSIVDLMPAEEVNSYSQITRRTLYYKNEEDIRGKVLHIEELVGMEEALEPIRMIVSAGVLAISSMEKDQRTGMLRSIERKIRAEIPILSGGTRDLFDEETLSRFILTYNDLSVEHVKRILKSQARKYSLDGAKANAHCARVEKRHRDIQKTFDKDLKVINPFAERIMINPRLHIVTRKQEQYLRLMYNIAFIRQHAREKFTGEDRYGNVFRYVLVQRDDVIDANEIMRYVFQYVTCDLTKRLYDAFQIILRYCMERIKEKRIGVYEFKFSRRELREHVGWDETAARRFFGELESLEYLRRVRGDRQGTQYLYQIVPYDLRKSGDDDLCLLDPSGL